MSMYSGSQQRKSAFRASELATSAIHTCARWLACARRTTLSKWKVFDLRAARRCRPLPFPSSFLHSPVTQPWLSVKVETFGSLQIYITFERFDRSEQIMSVAAFPSPKSPRCPSPRSPSPPTWKTKRNAEIGRLASVIHSSLSLFL